MSQISAVVSPVRSSQRTWKIVTWVLLVLLVLIVIAFFGIGAISASVFTKPLRNFDPTKNPGVYDLKYEEFTFTARNDQLPIAAWYIPSEQNQRVIILVHGKDNSRTDGFLGQFVPFANELHKAGFSVMMFDLRGHGESADSRFHFGITERNDILGAVDWLKARGYTSGQIGVLGYSLGAGSIIGAAAEEKDISAIWLDSAFAEVKSVAKNAFSKATGMPSFLFYSTIIMNRLLYGFDIVASRPIDDIGSIAPRPIFMTHCQKDGFIPIAQMDQLLTVAQNTQTWVIENCDVHTLDTQPENFDEFLNEHAIGYPTNPEEYTQKVIQFFDANLK